MTSTVWLTQCYRIDMCQNLTMLMKIFRIHQKTYQTWSASRTTQFMYHDIFSIMCLLIFVVCYFNQFLTSYMSLFPVEVKTSNIDDKSVLFLNTASLSYALTHSLSLLHIRGQNKIMVRNPCGYEPPVWQLVIDVCNSWSHAGYWPKRCFSAKW